MAARNSHLSELVSAHFDHVTNRTVKGVNLASALSLGQEISLEYVLQVASESKANWYWGPGENAFFGLNGGMWDMLWEPGSATLRGTFDEVALLYDRMRPGYPEALFDGIATLSGSEPGGRVLEIGCGTGQATVPLARRGYRILAVELGENLAAVARYHLRDYPQAQVVTSAFEEWPLEEEAAFDLAVSATAFHWLDPAVAYPKVARALKPGGSIALFWNVHVRSDADSGFFDTVQDIYQREAPELWREDHHPLPTADQVAEATRREIAATELAATARHGIEASRLFGPVTVRRYPWEATYDAAQYTALLDTYSGHRNLDAPQRERLFRGIAERIDTGFGGRITKAYLAMLFVANRI